MEAKESLLGHCPTEMDERGQRASKKGISTVLLVALVGSAALFSLLAIGLGASSSTISTDGLAWRSGRRHGHDSAVRTVNFTKGVMPFDLSPASDRQWDSLLPTNRGFVTIEGPDGERQLRGISMFHQLHCLRMLRDLLQEFERQKREQELGRPAPLPNIQKHMLHCFDYLVQGITCSADGTLEPTLPNTTVVNGYDIVHQCQDAGRLWELAGAASTKG